MVELGIVKNEGVIYMSGQEMVVVCVIKLWWIIIPLIIGGVLVWLTERK
jgi:hypothetical protein